MSKHIPRESPDGVQAPLLSHVEMVAVLAWIRYELAKHNREMLRWQEANDRTPSEYCRGQLDYHRKAWAVFEASRKGAQQTLELRLTHKKLPKPVLTAEGVLDRPGVIH